MTAGAGANGAASELPENLRFGASIIREQISATENGDKFGVSRRVMLSVLTRTGPELVKWAGDSAAAPGGDDEGAFFATLESIIAYQDYLDAMLTLTKSAVARMMLAGSFAAGIEDSEADGVGEVATAG